MSGVGYIWCAEVADVQVPVTGSIETNCEECGAPIWASPKAQNIMRESSELGVAVRVICGGCGMVIALTQNEEVQPFIDPKVFVEAIKRDQDARLQGGEPGTTVIGSGD